MYFCRQNAKAHTKKFTTLNNSPSKGNVQLCCTNRGFEDWALAKYLNTALLTLKGLFLLLQAYLAPNLALLLVLLISQFNSLI